MTDTKEIQQDINRLKKIIIHQIKNSIWKKNTYKQDYENELFTIKKDDYKVWYIRTKDGDSGRELSEFEAKHIFNKFELYFYIHFYINPKCRNYQKLQNKQTVSKATQKFLEVNKKEDRNSKLTELFEHG